MDLDDVLNLLDKTPVVIDIHPVSLCYLPESVEIAESLADVAWRLDSPEEMLPRQILCTVPDPYYRHRFPHVRCSHDPFTSSLNNILFDCFGQVANRMLCQSQIAQRIAADAQRYDIVVLFVVDGLGYHDVRDWSDYFDGRLKIEPCLVDVPTLTSAAFPNLVGHPTVASRLFDLGFHSRIGFTYWSREDNPLTNRIFATIPQVAKVAHFDRLVVGLERYLRGKREDKVYVQIVRTGLDGYAHRQKRKPPVTAIVEDIRKEYETVANVVEGMEAAACVYLTSDHGILWQNEFDPQIVGDAPGKSSPRWSSWKDLYYQQDKGRRFVVNDREYYCLGFPKLRRPLHIDEQGVHGGISYQESVVPFVAWR